MNETRLAAVINCGSSSIRMIIAQYSVQGGDPVVVESVIKYLGLGREVFTTGLIRKRSLSQAILIFQQYKEFLQGYGIQPQEVQVIGTAALREARNRDSFVDRVEVRTGFRINVIDGMEENRLTYMAVQFALKEKQEALSRDNTIIMEVGGGGTEVILLKKGKICAVHSLSFGTIRLEESMRGSLDVVHLAEGTIRQTIRPMKEMLEAELRFSTVEHVVIPGNYAKLVAELVGTHVNERYSVITKEALGTFARDVGLMEASEYTRKLGIPQAAAEGLGTAVYAYSQFIEESPCQEIWVPRGGTSEGLLMEMGPGIDPSIQIRFINQVRASAHSLGKKYHFDSPHAKHVVFLSVTLYDQLRNEHNLGAKHRLLLEIAAILHDIGTFVKPSGHHKHSQYLVENSEIFGLDSRDISIISNVVRYHRKTLPNPSHVNYASLPREDRLIVLKLAAILRVADALDRGHTQKIRTVTVTKRGEELLLEAQHLLDITAERFSLVDKANLFEEVYGLRVSLI